MPSTSLLADLRSVLAERDFRRLFTVRLISQAGDGIVTAGVGTYVFFNPLHIITLGFLCPIAYQKGG